VGRHTVFIVILVVIGLALAACGTEQATPSPGGTATSEPTPTDGGDATGGTVRIGIGGSPDSLNPGNGLLSEAYTLYELVYDTPIGVDSSGEFVPELATDWTVSDDGLTWTLTIVEGATFHDGEPLTASDVAFSLTLYRDNDDFPFLSSYVYDFVEIEAPDDTTVVITTEEPVGNFESRLAFMYVVPEHVWAELDDPVDFANTEMIGSGPFAMAEYRQGEYTRLSANRDYWNGAPNVDEVIFQTISNADARITALTNGEVDAITEFPATAVANLRNQANIEVYIADVAAGGSFRDVFFNMVAPEDCPEDGVCSGHPALQDVTVRQALAMAVDKQQIIDVAYLGLASPGVSLVPPGLGEFYIGDGAAPAFDADAAAQMLEDAGYVDSDGDGIRECLPDQDCPGGNLVFRFHYADDIDTAPREAELLKDMWNAIGVDITIQGLDPDTLTSICCPTFDYDIMLWGWGSDPDPQFLLGVTLCDEIGTGFSETGYCNPEYDELYYAQAVETDEATRVGMIHEMQRILIEDVPYIIPYYQQFVQAYRTDRFTGWPTSDPTLGIEDPSSLTVIRPAQ
jgi:peptide/nickel transport system substrate-binding protein